MQMLTGSYVIYTFKYVRSIIYIVYTCDRVHIGNEMNRIFVFHGMDLFKVKVIEKLSFVSLHFWWEIYFIQIDDWTVEL